MLECGVISSNTPSELGLTRAASRHVALRTRMLDLDERPGTVIAGLILDVPLESRGATLRRVASVWDVPILVEAPAASDVEQLRDLAESAGDRIVSANPLRYALHTLRLVEELRATGDPLEILFAAQRFRGPSLPADALPQLLDYLVDLCPVSIERVAALSREDPSLQIVTLRYANGALGSLEVGAHLPSSFPTESELTIECFGRSHAFHCAPTHQAVAVYNATSQRQLDWQPRPADAIVSDFASWLQGGPRPRGDVSRDLATVNLIDCIAESSRTDRPCHLSG